MSLLLQHQWLHVWTASHTGALWVMSLVSQWAALSFTGYLCSFHFKTQWGWRLHTHTHIFTHDCAAVNVLWETLTWEGFFTLRQNKQWSILACILTLFLILIAKYNDAICNHQCFSVCNVHWTQFSAGRHGWCIYGRLYDQVRPQHYIKRLNTQEVPWKDLMVLEML